ncbi:MAG: NUDIX domain-containing protein [Acholeplasmataceae bacterium]
MKLIAPRIIEPGTEETQTDQKVRTTVRAVFLNGKKETLMVYSFLFNDYTFAGGGVKDDETHQEALKRELKEELGVDEFDVVKPLGAIEELRFGINGSDSIYLQTSYYYLCEIIKIGAAKPNKREQKHGMTPKWIKIDDAIARNSSVLNDDNHQKKGLKTVLIRENKMLEYLKKGDSNNEEV